MCGLMPWNLIYLIHGQLAECNLPLPMPFPHSDLHLYHPDMNFFESCLSIHRNYLIDSIHFSPILKENLCHLFMPIVCWYEQRSGAILRNQPWSAKANTQKRMITKQMLDNIHLLPFFFTFKKMQTQHWLHQSITHPLAFFRKHALSIGTRHWCTNVAKNAN